MSNPEVAVLQLGVLVFAIMLGFPVAFTLMALGIGFGFYAYYDAGLFEHDLQPHRRRGSGLPSAASGRISARSSATASSISSSTAPTRSCRTTR